jgi:hypothetical protein
MGYTQNEPFLAFGGKIDPLSEIRNAGIVTAGSVMWVKNPSDAAYRTLKDQVGASVLKDTPQAGIDKTTNDAGDYVLVVPQDANAAWDLGTDGGLNVNKTRIHLLGMGYTRQGNGYRNTLRGFGSTAAMDTEVLNITAGGVEIAGLKFQGTAGTNDNGTITAIARLGTASSGTPHGLYMHDCVIENTNASAPGGTSPVVSMGAAVGAGGVTGMMFERVTFSSPSWFPAILVNLAVSGTAGPSETIFDNCLFTGRVQATTDSFLNLGTGATNYSIVRNSTWFNTNEGTLPASAVIGALLADNPLILANNVAIGVTQQGTDTQAYKTPAFSGTAATLRDPALGIGTAALINS